MTAPAPRDPDDPTRITAQPALTTSSGRSWLIVGGLLALISLIVLVPMTALPPAGVAFVAALVVFALYAGMVVIQLGMRAGRRRLALLAALMLAIAAVALIGAFVVAWTAAGSTVVAG